MKHIETFYTTKNIKDLKLAIFSDLHYYDNFNVRTLNKIEKQINKVKPNYICIIGDIVDEAKFKKLDNLITFLQNLSKISPIICVLGNHDEKSGSLWSWKYEKNIKLIEGLKSINNLHLLEDNTYQDGNICFYGFNFSFKYYEHQDETYQSFTDEAYQLKTKLSKDNYNIVLFHSPINIYRFIEENPTCELAKANLILSGHTHNGILPFWLSYPINKLFKSNIGLISPQKKFFPKIAQGRIKGPIDGYIHEGITKLSHSTKKFHIFDIFFFKNIETINIKKSN